MKTDKKTPKSSATRTTAKAAGDKVKSATARIGRAAKAATSTAASPPARPTAPKKRAAKVVAPPAATPTSKVRPVARTRTQAPTAALPPILLEGDESPAPAVSGPGERYVLGPKPPKEDFSATGSLGELPEAYGTGRLLLAARDPHWLYAHWDFTEEQLRAHNRASRDGHLVVRVFRNTAGGVPLTETHVHPESRNWFLHVVSGGEAYVAELGYYAKRGGKWASLATSSAVITPPDTMSDDASVEFATIPIELSFRQMLALLKQAARDNIPLVEAIQHLRATGHRGLPDAATLAAGTWTPAQERALGEIVSMDAVRRVWMGSLEITELLRGHLLKELSSIGAAQLGEASSLNLSSLSSPFGGGAAGRKGFWFNVNAELIIYGATEPDATVTIGGRRIKLRGDGSFSFRFALPDGKFNLPAIATNADGDDTRIADLAFSRSTEYSGEVGRHPQDVSLRPPTAEHVA
jgi:hypothetical protein